MKLQTWVNSRSLFCPFFWRYLQGRYLGGETFTLVIMLRLPIRWLWLGSTCTLQQQQVVGAVWTKLKKKLLECYRLKLQFTALKRRGNALSHFFSRHIKRVILYNTHSKHGSWGKKHHHTCCHHYENNSYAKDNLSLFSKPTLVWRFFKITGHFRHLFLVNKSGFEFRH